MGLKSRGKGQRFERAIVNDLKPAFPEFADELCRSIQSRGAENCDVSGLPRVWLECQDDIDPTPGAKLEQAERDRPDERVLPVAVTHRIRARSIQATLRLGHLQQLLRHPRMAPDRCYRALVTLDWEEFKVLLRETAPWAHDRRYPA